MQCKMQCIATCKMLFEMLCKTVMQKCYANCNAKTAMQKCDAKMKCKLQCQNAM